MLLCMCLLVWALPGVCRFMIDSGFGLGLGLGSEGGHG